MFMEDYVNLCFVKKHCLRNSNNVRERIFHGNTNIFFFLLLDRKAFVNVFIRKLISSEIGMTNSCRIFI